MKKNCFISILITGLLVACSNIPSMPTTEPITLRFATLGRAETFQALAEEYHQLNPAVNIEIIEAEGRSWDNDSVMEQLGSVDAFRVNSQFLDPERRELLRSLDEFMVIDRKFDRSDFFPGSLKGLQIEGVQYGLPGGLTPMVMVYDPLRLKIAEAEPLNPDYTLDEFLAAASLVNNQDPSAADEGLFAYGFCTHPDKEDAAYLTYLFGGGLFDTLPVPTQPTLNSRENVQAVRWYENLYEDFQVVPPADMDVGEVYRLIYSNQCGYWMAWLNQFGFRQDEGNELGVLPLPRGAKQLGFSLMDGYFLTKSSQHPQEAYDFINFLVNRLEASNGSIPPLLSQINSAEFENFSPELAEIARRLPQESQFIGFDPSESDQFSQTYLLFQNAVKEVIQGSVDPEFALEDAQNQAEELFK
jgi:ABC-type glycerol-3-phosphate transport system substrate-binding protein